VALNMTNLAAEREAMVKRHFGREEHYDAVLDAAGPARRDP
jgi:hypothetical protein